MCITAIEMTNKMSCLIRENKNRMKVPGGSESSHYKDYISSISLLTKHCIRKRIYYQIMTLSIYTIGSKPCEAGCEICRHFHVNYYCYRNVNNYIKTGKNGMNGSHNDIIIVGLPTFADGY